MEVQIHVVGIGATLPRIDVGVNVFSYSTIAVRNNPAAKPTIYKIEAYPELGSTSGSQVIGYAITDWLKVNEESKSLLAFTNLIGKIVDLEVKGTNLISGQGDITLQLIDKNNEAQTVLSKYAVKIKSSQLASTRIRGRIINIPSANNFSSGKIR